jgi:hypothetical protein
VLEIARGGRMETGGTPLAPHAQSANHEWSIHEDSTEESTSPHLEEIVLDANRVAGALYNSAAKLLGAPTTVGLVTVNDPIRTDAVYYVPILADAVNYGDDGVTNKIAAHGGVQNNVFDHVDLEVHGSAGDFLERELHGRREAAGRARGGVGRQARQARESR